MHILVTGATGFVGHALLRKLSATGHKITAISRPGNVLPSGIDLLPHVLGSRERLIVPDGTDAIVHLAQSRAHRLFPQDAAEMFSVNVAGTQELLEAAAAAKVTRFCLVSTGSVYDPYTQPLLEGAPLSPPSYLGASKLAAEIVALPFGALFPVSVLRLFTPYGPGQAGRLVPDLVRRIRLGEDVTLPLLGDGMRFAPTFVEDICDVIASALNKAWRGPFNVAPLGSVTIREAAEVIGQAVGRPPKFVRKEINGPSIVPDLTHFSSYYDVASMLSFSQGIERTIGRQS